MTYVAFLWYVAVVTTYQLPGASVAMIVALGSLLMSREWPRLPAVVGWLGAFIAWGAVGYPVTRFPEQVQEHLIQLAKVWLITLVAANVLRTRAQIRFFVIFFLACFALYPLRGALFNYYGAGYSLHGRALWNFIYGNPNDLAAMALLQLSMVVGLLVTEPRRSWVWMAALIGTALLPLLILMTQSRAGFLALSVLAMLLLLTRWRRPPVILAAAVLAVSVAIIAPRGVWTRIGGLTKATSTTSLGAVDREGSAAERAEIWKVAARMIRDQPVTGVGLGAYPLAHAAYSLDAAVSRGAQGNRDAHNTMLNVLAETGVPGLLLFLTLVIGTVWNAERIRRACRARLPRSSTQLLYLEFGLAAFLVAGVFGSFAHLPFLYLHLVLIWAVAESCRQGGADIASREGVEPRDPWRAAVRGRVHRRA